MLRIISLLIVALTVPVVQAQPGRARHLEFFEKKVRPVLADHCFSCHGGAKVKGGVRLDRKDFVFKMSDEPLIVPGHPEKSLLVKAIRHEIDTQDAAAAQGEAVAPSDRRHHGVDQARRGLAR